MSPDFQYIGRVPLSRAIHLQNEISQSIFAGGQGCVLGFEADPVVTMGIRARPEDLLIPEEPLRQAGFDLMPLDRGGQATVHNPGQLVVFPVLMVRELGARAWICLLARTTMNCLARWGIEAKWDERRPGVYTAQGKIASIGVRIGRGVSTHGVSLNIHNDLSAFDKIRVCGAKDASLDRMVDHLAEAPLSVEAVFREWEAQFRQQWGQRTPTQLTSEPFSPNLGSIQTAVRS